MKTKTKTKKVNPLGSDFDVSLDQDLKDPMMAAYFINAAVEDNDADYLKIAIGRVARVHGISDISKFTDLGREAIYKMLSETGNPGLRNIQQILSALGLELSVRAKGKSQSEIKDGTLVELIRSEARSAVREVLSENVQKNSVSRSYKSRPTKKKLSTKKLANIG